MLEKLNLIQEAKFGNSTFEFLSEDLDQLQKQFEKSKLITVGEMHGVQQNYDIYRFLIKSLGVEQVALELPKYLVGFLEQCNGNDFFDSVILARLQTYSGDGRISESAIDFIKYLKQVDVDLKLIDNHKFTNDQSGSEYSKLRDCIMAQEITQLTQNNQRTLAIAGNYHTDPNREGSFSNILDKNGKLFVSSEIEYRSGEYYNNDNPRSFAIQDSQQTDSIIFTIDELTQNPKFVIPKGNSVKMI